MDSKNGRNANLKKYLAYNCNWQFLPGLEIDGRPKPELVIIQGKPRRGTSGTFFLDWRFLDWRENGKRRTRHVGTSPREALDAWRLHSASLPEKSTHWKKNLLRRGPPRRRFELLSILDRNQERSFE